MLKAFLASACLIAGFTAASAQTDMSCGDFLKAKPQMDAASGPALDADAAAMDRKMSDFCRQNPSAKVSEAMEKAFAD